jgi:hypothetical protein
MSEQLAFSTHEHANRKNISSFSVKVFEIQTMVRLTHANLKLTAQQNLPAHACGAR